MPKVRITKTIPIAEDGIHVRKYSAGWEGEVSDTAANLLVSCGAATIVMERTAPPPPNAPPVPSEGTILPEPSEKKEKVVGDRSSAMRVWQLSEETGVSSARLLQIAKEIGISVKSPMSGLSKEETTKIRSEMEKPKR